LFKIPISETAMIQAFACHGLSALGHGLPDGAIGRATAVPFIADECGRHVRGEVVPDPDLAWDEAKATSDRHQYPRPRRGA
jgi:hypothetical protein